MLGFVFKGGVTPTIGKLQVRRERWKNIFFSPFCPVKIFPQAMKQPTDQ